MRLLSLEGGTGGTGRWSFAIVLLQLSLPVEGVVPGGRNRRYWPLERVYSASASNASNFAVVSVLYRLQKMHFFKLANSTPGSSHGYKSGRKGKKIIILMFIASIHVLLLQ